MTSLCVDVPSAVDVVSGFSFLPVIAKETLHKFFEKASQKTMAAAANFFIFLNSITAQMRMKCRSNLMQIHNTLKREMVTDIVEVYEI